MLSLCMLLLHLTMSSVFLVSQDTDQQPVVNTHCGQVQGISADGAYSFRGIPYAVPPLGDRRWRPPVALSKSAGTCWSGTFQATKFGNSCYQRNPFNTSEYTGSEDCLVLNVWTPAVSPTVLKPVMVWLHGGSLQQSNANWPLYSPTEALARDTDVVYVGMNYRLQAFGFMALQVLADDSETKASGNYGFLDMIEAMRWIQTHIAQFGGDPHQVTIFGQSSGGTAMLALLSSPMSEGLFHKAWMLSASPVYNKSAADAYRDNELFLKNTGCDDVGCLRHLTAADVTTAVPWDVYPYWGLTDQLDLPVKNYFDGAICIVDGYMIQEAPFVAWRRGHMMDVPLIIGTTANEVDFSPTYLDMNTWTWDVYEEHVGNTLGTFGGNTVETALKMYPRGVISPEYQFTSIASDIRVNCANDVMAMAAAESFKAPVYRYVVTSTPSKPVHILGMPFPSSYSFHMWDVFAFFGVVGDFIKEPTEEDLQWQRNVRAEILSFVKTGKPKSAEWAPFPGSTALLSGTTTPENGYHVEECKYWLKNGFFNYAWIN